MWLVHTELFVAGRRHGALSFWTQRLRGRPVCDTTLGAIRLAQQHRIVGLPWMPV